MDKKHHNWALKNLRSQFEQAKLGSHEHLTLDDRPYTFKVINHPNARSAVADPDLGAVFEFGTKEFEWHWHDLVSWLRDGDIGFLLNVGTSAVTRINPAVAAATHELIACDFAPEAGSIDIGNVRRDRAQARDEQRPPEYSSQNRPLVFDFVLTRSDGVCFRLHPSHSNNKVTCKMGQGTGAVCAPPASGLYGTDGPGTFRRIKDWNKLGDLRFDTAAVRAAEQRAAARRAAQR